MIILFPDIKGRILKKPGGDHFGLSPIFRGDDRPDKYEVFGDVKAVTYNEMRIERGSPASVQVVLDI